MDDSKQFSFQDFLVTAPLYTSETIEKGGILRLLFFDRFVKIDAHCPSCGRESVFHSENVSGFNNPKADAYLFHGAHAITFACQRNASHKM